MTSASKVYRWCMEATGGDAQYCADVKEVVAQVASTRAFSYAHPSGKPRFLLFLPSTIYVDVLESEEVHDSLLLAARAAYAAKILLDEERRGVIVTLQAPSHAISLLYERRDKLTLKKAVVSNVEIAALMNGPLKLGQDHP